MLYLSHLLNQPIRDRHGNQLARISDLIVTLPAPVAEAAQAARYDTYPRLHGLVARGGQAAAGFFVPLAAVATLGPGGAELSASAVSLETFARRPGELLLAGNLADHSIIDCREALVRRVNDVIVGTLDEAGAISLAEAGTGAVSAADLVLLGVDVGWSGFVRRLGLGRLGGPLRMAGRRLPPAVLPWPDLALAGPGGGGAALSALHPADLARISEALSYHEAADLIAGLDDETAADVMEEVDPERATDIMEQLPDARAADIIEEMGPDEASDLLADLPAARAAGLLDEMEPEAAEDVRELLRYPEASAGGMMTTSFITCPRHYTVAQAIDLLRTELDKPDLIYYLFVTQGPEDHLLGIVTLRRLLISAPTDRIEAIMRIDPETARPTDSPREVARTMAEYNLLALPVVGDTGNLLGIITVDDALELLLPDDWQRKLTRLFNP
jgi:CBS domain-containing protein